MIKFHSLVSLFLCMLLAAPISAQQAEAVASIFSLPDKKFLGNVKIVEEAGKTSVSGKLTDLGAGKHGFHIHQNGDCSAADGSSAGGHFGVQGQHHGSVSGQSTHIGDLGNINADKSGTAKIEVNGLTKLPLKGENSVIGRAIIVHANADDLHSQPSGNAGGRIACGVIGYAQPQPK